MTTEPEPSERTALYRFFDAAGNLLYVGVSGNTEARWRQHAESKPWWSDVADKTTEWLGSRAEALDAERIAIRTEKPLHNHQNKPSSIIGEITPWGPSGVPGGTWSPYEFIAHELKGFIQSGSMRAGDRFPTVRTLMEVYGVASLTIQRALNLLKTQGFAVGRQGFGVVAVVPPGLRSETAGGEGAEGVLEQMTAYRAAPSLRSCTALGVEPGTELDAKRWVRVIDGQPVELVNFYRYPDAPVDEAIHRTTDLVTAAPPIAEAVKVFGVVPLLITRRVTYSESQSPLGLYEIVKNGDLLATQYEF
ncbi:GntR family transcriptional regulator [Streptomyces ortus]|uniref:GntR family transcriptional regulator n=1 Tax=Streptomyces ortus TaxID=2867268 RepID=A0ABT3UWX2_9ACTN|nr:GntR family transcriptional regulator [Streptomyces ortus]MCX4232061.1 GntR family transcriptional regulator [Streptomyces ortus]